MDSTATMPVHQPLQSERWIVHWRSQCKSNPPIGRPPYPRCRHLARWKMYDLDKRSILVLTMNISGALPVLITSKLPPRRYGSSCPSKPIPRGFNVRLTSRKESFNLTMSQSMSKVGTITTKVENKSCRCIDISCNNPGSSYTGGHGLSRQNRFPYFFMFRRNFRFRKSYSLYKYVRKFEWTQWQMLQTRVTSLT